MEQQLQASNTKISYHKICHIMTQEGIPIQSENKSKRRKWVGYERSHSNVMWHVDWYVMKYPRLERVNLIVCLDDAWWLLSNHGSQFTSSRPTSKSRITACQQGLQTYGITQVLARVKHPQTDGKIERFFRTLEEAIEHFGGAARSSGSVDPSEKSEMTGGSDRQ